VAWGLRVGKAHGHLQVGLAQACLRSGGVGRRVLMRRSPLRAIWAKVLWPNSDASATMMARRAHAIICACMDASSGPMGRCLTKQVCRACPASHGSGQARAGCRTLKRPARLNRNPRPMPTAAVRRRPRGLAGNALPNYPAIGLPATTRARGVVIEGDSDRIAKRMLR
jgi:hypothetical protein